MTDIDSYKHKVVALVDEVVDAVRTAKVLQDSIDVLTVTRTLLVLLDPGIPWLEAVLAPDFRASRRATEFDLAALFIRSGRSERTAKRMAKEIIAEMVAFMPDAIMDASGTIVSRSLMRAEKEATLTGARRTSRANAAFLMFADAIGIELVLADVDLRRLVHRLAVLRFAEDLGAVVEAAEQGERVRLALRDSRPEVVKRCRFMVAAVQATVASDRDRVRQ
jgi:hypothetical protein